MGCKRPTPERVVQLWAFSFSSFLHKTESTEVAFFFLGEPAWKSPCIQRSLSSAVFGVAKKKKVRTKTEENITWHSSSASVEFEARRRNKRDTTQVKDKKKRVFRHESFTEASALWQKKKASLSLFPCFLFLSFSMKTLIFMKCSNTLLNCCSHLRTTACC